MLFERLPLSASFFRSFVTPPTPLPHLWFLSAGSRRRTGAESMKTELTQIQPLKTRTKIWFAAMKSLSISICSFSFPFFSPRPKKVKLHTLKCCQNMRATLIKKGHFHSNYLHIHSLALSCNSIIDNGQTEVIKKIKKNRNDYRKILCESNCVCSVCVRRDTRCGR